MADVNELATDRGPNDDTNGLELQCIRAREADNNGREQVALAPADTGYRAWLLLAGCFVINVLIWGEFSQNVFIVEVMLTAQDLHSPLEFYKNTTPLMSHSPVTEVVSPQLEQLQPG
jgi:hypothetical protein